MNSLPGVSEAMYDSFTENERILFDLALQKGSMKKAQELTGLDYGEVKALAENLIRKGVAIRINQGSSIIFSFYYSPYAEDYEERINKIKGDIKMSLPFAKIEDKSWESVVDYLNKRMARNRQHGGKHNAENRELFHLKKAMSEVDPTITNVGTSFHDHENKGYDTKEGAE